MANKSMLALGAIIGLGVVGALVVLAVQWLGDDSAEVGPEAQVEPATTRPSRGGRKANGPRPLDPVDPAEGDSTPPPREAVTEPEAVVDQPAFLYEGYEASLNALDWKSIAENLFHLSRDMPLVGFGIQRGDVSDEVTTRVLNHLSELGSGLTVGGRRVGGMEETSILTHPAYFSNALAKTLEAAGRPLSAEQREQLEALTRRILPEDTKRLKELPSGAIRMRRIATEMGLRAAYVDEARGLLDKRQRIAVGAGPFENRVGLDPFSPGMHLRNRLSPIPMGDESGFRSTIFGDLLVPLLDPRDEEEHDAAMELLRPWWDKAPQPPPEASGRLTIAGHPTLARALEATLFTAALIEDVLEKRDVKSERARMAGARLQVLLPVRLR